MLRGKALWADDIRFNEESGVMDFCVSHTSLMIGVSNWDTPQFFGTQQSWYCEFFRWRTTKDLWGQDAHRTAVEQFGVCEHALVTVRKVGGDA